MNKTSQISQTGSNLKPETCNLKPGRVPSSLISNPSTGFGKTPSSLLPHPSTDKETFQYPPSVQIDLFNYLKPHQQKALKPYLRIVKRPYQEKLCVSLLDYLEGHGLDTLEEPVLATLQEEIVQACNLHPLTSRQPKSIGTVIKQLFPSLTGSLIPNP